MMPTIYSRFATLALVALAACAAHEPTHDGALISSEDALIAFPAASYASAPLVTYGSSTPRAFTTADGFVAIKFNGRKGDIVRFGATTATGGDAVSYLVVNKRNVAALRMDSDPPSTYRFTLDRDGEYFVMMRSRDSSSVRLRALLDRLNPKEGLNTAVRLTNAPFVAATKSGEPPKDVFVAKRAIAFRKRTCATATGCSALTDLDFVLTAELSVRVSPNPSGPVLEQILNIRGTREGTPDGSLPTLASSKTDATLGTPSVRLDFRLRAQAPSSAPNTLVAWTELKGAPGSAGAIVTRVHAEPIKVPSVGSTQSWLQYEADDLEVPWAMPSNVESRDTDAPPVFDSSYASTIPAHISQTPLNDETVLSRFRPGTTSLLVHQSWAPLPTGLDVIGSAAGTQLFSRRCGPRTGCERQWTIEDSRYSLATTRPWEAQLRVLYGDWGTPVSQIELRVTGPDSYGVFFLGAESPGRIYKTAFIENGVGPIDDFQATKATVTAQGVLLRYAPTPKIVVERKDEVRRYGEYLALNRLSPREGGYTQEFLRNRGDGGYMFIPFNMNW